MNPPEPTHLGMAEGEWPIRAFTDENGAAYWAAEEPRRRVIWGVLSIELGPPLQGRKINEVVLEPRE